MTIEYNEMNLYSELFKQKLQNSYVHFSEKWFLDSISARLEFVFCNEVRGTAWEWERLNDAELVGCF